MVYFVSWFKRVWSITAAKAGQFMPVGACGWGPHVREA